MREKKRTLGEKEGRTNLGRRKNIEMYRNYKNRPNISLFIARVL